MQMFNLLNSILERLADSVKPFLGLILQILPGLWEQSSSMVLLRIQVGIYAFRIQQTRVGSLLAPHMSVVV